MRVCLQLGRPGRAKTVYLLNEHSRGDSSKASTGRGTREPRQPRVPHSQTSFSPPPPCASTGAASRGRPWGSPCFLPPFSQALLHPPAPSPASRMGALPAREALCAPASPIPSPAGLLTLPFRRPRSPTTPQFPTTPTPTPACLPPPPPLAPGGNGVSSYLGHRRRW